MAEIGQAEIDRGNIEKEDNPEPQHENIVEGNNDPAGAGGDDLMAEGSPVPSTPREGPVTEQFDSSRRTPPTRRADNDDMDGDTQDKRLRPRSLMLSYRTDADPNGLEDKTLHGLNEVDTKILSAAILGVDVTEVYSPERVARVAKRFGLTTGSSMDLTNGCDFSRDDHKRQVWSKIREEAPRLLMRFPPPCSYLSVLQELNKAVHGDKLGWQEKLEIETGKAIKHVEFCCALFLH